MVSMSWSPSGKFTLASAYFFPGKSFVTSLYVPSGISAKSLVSAYSFPGKSLVTSLYVPSGISPKSSSFPISSRVSSRA